MNGRTGQFAVMGYAFEPTKKSNRDILDMLSKPKTSGHWGFPLANLHSAVISHYVPESNPYNKPILLYISPANQTKSRTQDLLSGFFVIWM